ncbi:MAG: shikimate dehydrogenase [Thermoplasmata archaeon]
MTKLCVPVYGREARKMADTALTSGADLVEIRADLIPNADAQILDEEFSGILNKAIITLRSREEGGDSTLSKKEREEWFERAIDLRPLFIDLELETDRKLIDRLSGEKRRIIVSKHFLSRWSGKIVGETLSECCKLGGIGKVAVKVENAMQSVDILLHVRELGLSNFAFMTMGEGGEISRACASYIGSQLTYCALSENRKVAPGQLDLKTQKRIEGKGSIIVGLIGHPLGHTFSPAMQNAAFEALGIPGAYLKFDIPDARRVVDFIKGSVRLGIRGFNVTIPYKEIAISALENIDNDARRAGAVNTICAETDGTLKGYNTDIFGFSEAVRNSGYNPRNKRALIVGAGGASRAAIIGLWKMGAKIVIANRTPERAEQLVRSMRVFIKTLPLAALDEEKPFSLIVNATPVGMRGFEGEQIIPENLVAKADAVMDMVYNPPDTPLVTLARKHKVKTIPGLDMLLYQGAKAFEIWSGKKPPVEIMREKLLEAIGS